MAVTIPDQSALSLELATSTAVALRQTRPDPDPALVRAVAGGPRGMRLTARNEGNGWADLDVLQREGGPYCVPLRRGLVALDLDHSNGALAALVEYLDGVAVVVESGGTVAQPAQSGESAQPRLHVLIRAQPSAADLRALRADPDDGGLGLTVRVGDGGPAGARMIRPPTAPHRHGLGAATVRGSHADALATLEGPDQTAALRSAIRSALAHGDTAIPPAGSPYAAHRGLREGRTRPQGAADPQGGPQGPQDAAGPQDGPQDGTGPLRDLDGEDGTRPGVLPAWLQDYAAQPSAHRRTGPIYRVVCWSLDRGWSVADTVAGLSTTPLWDHYERRAARHGTTPHDQATRHVESVLRDRGRRLTASAADLAALDRMADAVAAHTWQTLPGRPRGGTLHATAVALVAIARRAGRWVGLHVATRDLAERAGLSQATAQRALATLRADGLVRVDRQAAGTAAAVWSLDPWHSALRATHDTPAAPSAAAGPAHDAWRHSGLGHAARSVWAALATLGDRQTATAVAARIGYACPSTARRHLRRLRDAGLVDHTRDGWAVRDGTVAALDQAAVNLGTAGLGKAAREGHLRQRDGYRALIAERQRRTAEDQAAYDAMAVNGGTNQPRGTPWVPPTDLEAPRQGPDSPSPDPVLPDGPRPWDGVPDLVDGDPVDRVQVAA